MGRIRVQLLAWLVLLLFAVPAFGQTHISSCQTLSTDGASYLLTTDLSSPGTCMTIRGDNITLDLGGHTITFDTSAAGNTRGVYLNGTRNSRVENGKVVQFSGCVGEGPCARDTGVRVSGAFDTLVKNVEITVQGYDTFGIYMSSASSSCQAGTVNRLEGNTITHNGTYLSSRDGFSSEPIKIERHAGRFEVIGNRILASPQAGIMIYGYGDEGNGCNDGSEIADNYIDIDGALYANPGGIHGFHTPALHIHHNQIVGDGQEGIQLDGARFQKDGALTRIHDNQVDVDCNYWPRGHSAGRGILQGLRLRYTTEYVRVYNNTIKVHADAVDDTLERNTATGIHLTCARWNGSARTGGCTDVKIWGNTVEAVTTGSLEQVYAITIDGVEDQITSGVEIYSNTFRSNGTILRYFDQGTLDNSAVFHDNLMEFLPGARYNEVTFRVDWSNSAAWPMTPSVRDISFGGGASKSDVVLTGGGVSGKRFSLDWTHELHVVDQNGADVEGALVTMRDAAGSTEGQCTTDCTGRCSVVSREITYYRSDDPTRYNPHRVTATKGGDEASLSATVDGLGQESELVLANTDDPANCDRIAAPTGLHRSDRR